VKEELEMSDMGGMEVEEEDEDDVRKIRTPERFGRESGLRD
jgi:hypothetical protein